MAFESLQGKLGMALYMLCTFISFVFLVTSAPISQFKGKGMRHSARGVSRNTCVTVWGMKLDCHKNTYTYRVEKLTCSNLKSIFRATEAFYVVSIFFGCLACILCGVHFLGTNMKIVSIALGVAQIIFSLFPWVLMTVVWYREYCGEYKGVIINEHMMTVSGVPYGTVLRTYFSASAGYGLTIAAWCIQIIGLILMLVVTA